MYESKPSYFPTQKRWASPSQWKQFEATVAQEQVWLSVGFLFFGVAASCWPNFLLCPEERHLIGATLFMMAALSTVMLPVSAILWWVQRKSRLGVLQQIRRKRGDGEDEDEPSVTA